MPRPGEVKVLPNCPQTIDLSVMQIEGRITGAAEGVSAGIAIDSIVAAAVDTNTAGAWDTLHDHLEVIDIVVLEDEVFECF